MARIEKSIEVDVPLRVAYNQWTQFEEFPRFMEGVKEVHQIDDTHLHWKAEIAGKEKEWDAVIVEQIPDRRISWRSTTGAPNAGTVSFEPIPTGARVTLWVEYDPQGFLENVGDALGATSRRTEGDLRRFKEFVEARGRETGQWRGEVHQGRVTGREGAETSTMPSGTAATEITAAPAAARPSSAEGSTWPPPTDPSYWQGERDRRRAERRKSTTTTAKPASRGTGAVRRRQEPWGLGLRERMDEPFAALQRMSRDMEDLFEQILGRPMLGGRSAHLDQGALTPHVEVYQEGNELHVDADLPGVKREDVKLDVRDGHLTIEAERHHQESEEREGRYHSQESRGYFCRTIPLPEGADVDSARASLNDGVLRIVVPTPRMATGKRIPIRDDVGALPSAARR